VQVTAQQIPMTQWPLEQSVFSAHMPPFATVAEHWLDALQKPPAMQSRFDMQLVLQPVPWHL
jgi:hypothetical protein